MGLVSLAKREPYSAIDKACEIACSYGAFRLRNVRQLIAHAAPKQEQLEFMQEHPLIRNLSVYGELVKTALHQPAATHDNDLSVSTLSDASLKQGELR